MGDRVVECAGVIARRTDGNNAVFVRAYHLGRSVVVESHSYDARMTPAEARTFARQLQRLARRAEHPAA